MRSHILIVALAPLLLGCGADCALEPPPPGGNPDETSDSAAAGAEQGASIEWRDEDVGSFRFRVPVGVESVPVQGIDSQVGLLEGAGFRIRFDLGWYSDNSFDGKINSPGFRAQAIRLDGVQAQLASYTLDNSAGSRVVAVYAANVYGTPADNPGKTSLSFAVEYENAADSKVAEEIARSITGWKKRD